MRLGLATGKAKVAPGDAAGVVDMPGAVGAGVGLAVIVDVGVAEAGGLGVGVGVGGGGIMFSQWCNGAAAPPISSTRVWQRA